MDEKLKILLCEDEENLGVILRELLESKDFEVDLKLDGEQGWEAFAQTKYDLCLLDVMMPKRDGLSLAREIRRVDKSTPIIFLTALGMRDDILAGFHSGADDYVTKPFSMEELILRIEAILRRSNPKLVDTKVQESYNIGAFYFDTVAQTLTINGNVSRLTTKECELLGLLCKYANQTLERGIALREIWGLTDVGANDDHSFNQRSMDVYVTKLRRMLLADPRIEVKNVHGKGYKLIIPTDI